jgi:hypothetical protein
MRGPAHRSDREPRAHRAPSGYNHDQTTGGLTSARPGPGAVSTWLPLAHVHRHCCEPAATIQDRPSDFLPARQVIA